MNFTAEDKIRFRNASKELRNCIPQAERAKLSLEICSKIVDSPAFCSCKRLFAYMPIGSEADIRPVIDEAHRLSKAVFLPKCDILTGNMDFYRVSSYEGLVKNGKLGVLEPLGDSESLSLPDVGDLILVPGLAFDIFGDRIGYGKGMYDRFFRRASLAEKAAYAPPLAWGVTFKKLVSDKEIPHFEFDIQLCTIVTEEGITDTIRSAI